MKIVSLDPDFFGGNEGLDAIIDSLSLKSNRDINNAIINDFDDAEDDGMSNSNSIDVTPIRILCIGSGFGTVARYLATHAKRCEMVIALEGNKGLFNFF